MESTTNTVLDTPLPSNIRENLQQATEEGRTTPTTTQAKPFPDFPQVVVENNNMDIESTSASEQTPTVAERAPGFPTPLPNKETNNTARTLGRVFLLKRKEVVPLSTITQDRVVPHLKIRMQ